MKWAHLLCSLWIPEVSIGNQTFMEPIQDVEKVPKQRWKLVSETLTSLFLANCIRPVTYANKKWVLAYNVATKTVI
jgi:hypothetical protein